MKKLIKFITLEEFAKLRKAEKDPAYRLAMDLGFGSGLRLSEIVGLKRSDGKPAIPALSKDDVDLQAHSIRLQDAKGGKQRVTVTPPNMSETSLRLLPLNINRRTYQHRLKQLGKKVLGKDISPHTLRHGFGNYMVNVQKLPIPYVQSLMGHSRIDTTGIYTRANPVDAINAAWGAWR